MSRIIEHRLGIKDHTDHISQEVIVEPEEEVISYAEAYEILNKKLHASYAEMNHWLVFEGAKMQVEDKLGAVLMPFYLQNDKKNSERCRLITPRRLQTGNWHTVHFIKSYVECYEPPRRLLSYNNAIKRILPFFKKEDKDEAHKLLEARGRGSFSTYDKKGFTCIDSQNRKQKTPSMTERFYDADLIGDIIKNDLRAVRKKQPLRGKEREALKNEIVRCLEIQIGSFGLKLNQDEYFGILRRNFDQKGGAERIYKDAWKECATEEMKKSNFARNITKK